MAHKSLALKLKARKTKPNRSNATERKISETSFENILHLFYSEDAADVNNKDHEENFVKTEMKMVNYENNEIKDQNSNFEYKKLRNNTRSSSILQTFNEAKEIVDTRVDKVYTVGCFDLFHHGHVKLIERMREIGKKVVVGVHDSRRLTLTIFGFLK
jgi:bifunctional ADP-heptose synthase (sugar kinase/adenylyltransferase)